SKSDTASYSDVAGVRRRRAGQSPRKGAGMNRLRVALAVLALAASVQAADAPAKKTSKEALQACNGLIGPRKGTGTPEGTQAEKQKGFWIEYDHWGWKFKGDDAWLTLTIEDGKHFTGGELRYLAEKDQYQLTLRTPAKESLVFTGPLDKQRLVL